MSHDDHLRAPPPAPESGPDDARPRAVQLQVGPEEAGQKLLAFLERRLGSAAGRAQLHKWIRTGQVRVNKGRADPFDRLEEGDLVRVPPQGVSLLEAEGPAVRAGAGARGLGLPLLHDKDGLVVVHKPAGLAVQGGTGIRDCVVERIRAAYAGAAFLPTLVHRLDRDTSGLLLIATSFTRLKELHEAIHAGTLAKDYLAWVKGQWRPSGLWRQAVLRDRLAKAAEGKVVNLSRGQGDCELRGQAKEAAAVAMAVDTRGCAKGGMGPGSTLMTVRLLTGRTHQIRVQLSSRGHAIVGDAKYGGGMPPMMLHAWRLRLPTGERFEAAPPWLGRMKVEPELLAEIKWDWADETARRNRPGCRA